MAVSPLRSVHGWNRSKSPRPRRAVRLAHRTRSRTAAVRPSLPGGERGHRRDRAHRLPERGRWLRPRARTRSSRARESTAAHRSRAERSRLDRPLRGSACGTDLPLSDGRVHQGGRAARAPPLPARLPRGALHPRRRRPARRTAGDGPGGRAAAPESGLARLAVPGHRLLLGRRRRPRAVPSVRDRGGRRLPGRCPRPRTRRIGRRPAGTTGARPATCGARPSAPCGVPGGHAATPPGNITSLTTTPVRRGRSPAGGSATASWRAPWIIWRPNRRRTAAGRSTGGSGRRGRPWRAVRS